MLPRAYLDRVQELYPAALAARALAARPSLYDIDDRLRVMERFPGYVQILTLAQPPIEALGDGAHAAELARLANDGMAAIVRAHPDRFVGFACALPMHDPEAAVRELERAVGALGALGAQIHTHVRGMPLDEPRFLPVFAKLVELDVALWVHPQRGPEMRDYPTEERVRYGTFIAFGWPYETAVFMTRLVFSGVIDRHPSLRILTHHAGGMIPSFAQRVGKGMEPPPGWPSDPAALTERALRTYRRAYGDTALNGNLAAVRCGVDFFGADHILFGTDMPWDDENGVAYIRDTIANVDALEIDASAREAIYAGNARRVLKVRA